MFSVTLICMGKLKEKFYTAAASEYEKRLQGYCQFKLLELLEVRLPENPSPAEIAAGLEVGPGLVHDGHDVGPLHGHRRRLRRLRPGQNLLHPLRGAVRRLLHL